MLIFAGTNEEHARLVVWDISTNTYIYEIRFHQAVTIPIIKVSTSNRYAVLLVVDRLAQYSLLFIELATRHVLASHRFYEPLELNDLAFVLEEEFRWLACGNNYIAEWCYENGTLSSFNYHI